ncbi:hypothetical protein, partial [Blautia faecis]
MFCPDEGAVARYGTLI